MGPGPSELGVGGSPEARAVPLYSLATYCAIGQCSLAPPGAGQQCRVSDPPRHTEPEPSFTRGRRGICLRVKLEQLGLRHTASTENFPIQCPLLKGWAGDVGGDISTFGSCCWAMEWGLEQDWGASFLP